MSTVYNDPIMLDSTGQDIVTKLDSIASLMGDGVIDDTSTTATDKTWSASKENTVVNGLQSNVIANTKLIKDTVGWSGKNKLKNTGVTSTIHNVTFTENSDKSVTINGTASATIFFRIGQIQDKGSQILNGVTGGSFNTYGLTVRTADDQHPSFGEVNNYNGDTLFTVPSDYSNALYVNIRVPSGATVNNVTVYPMIRDDDILDPTYEPYFGSTAFPRSEQAVLGAKNLLPNNWSWEDTGTLDGITLTRNSDDTITVGEGTVSGGGGKWLFNTTLANLGIKKGRYKVTANIPSSLGGNVFFTIKDNTGNVTYNVTGSTQEVEFEVTDVNINHTWHIYTWFNNNTVISESFVMQPMIRLASDTDNTFAPFAMTNKELTEKKADDMCATGEYTLNLVACAVTPSNGQPEFFIPWTNPKKKSITLGSSFKVYRRNNSSWEELTWTTPPTILAYENGFYIGLTLDTPLTAEQIYGFRVQGKIIFS